MAKPKQDVLSSTTGYLASNQGVGGSSPSQRTRFKSKLSALPTWPFPEIGLCVQKKKTETFGNLGS